MKSPFFEKMIREQTEQALESLGSDVAEVTSSLARGRYYGRRWNPWGCVFWRYLSRTFPQRKFCVEGYSVTVRQGDISVCVMLPQPCKEFICQFDGSKLNFMRSGLMGSRDRLIMRPGYRRFRATLAETPTKPLQLPPDFATKVAVPLSHHEQPLAA